MDWKKTILSRLNPWNDEGKQSLSTDIGGTCSKNAEGGIPSGGRALIPSLSQSDKRVVRTYQQEVKGATGD